MSVIYLSLCIPTNGISKWVLPVLESIYMQNTNQKEFEVVLVDNGNSEDLNETKLEKFISHDNFHYIKSESKGFMNQVFAFSKCKGKLIKFVNHRFIMANGSVEFLINFSKKWSKIKPFIYFNNNGKREEQMYNNSNDFFKELGISSSWSGGVAFWNEDNPFKNCSINETFPHFALFETKKSQYIINNEKIFEREIDPSAINKGKYNVFEAFALEYMVLNLNLLKKGLITLKVFKHIKKDTSRFISKLYLDFVILKKPCSYLMDNYKDWIQIFFNFFAIKLRSFMLLFYFLLRGRL